MVDLRERFDRTKPQSGPFVRLEDIKGDLELSIQLVANGLSAADVGSGSTAVRPWGLCSNKPMKPMVKCTAKTTGWNEVQLEA